VASIEKMKLYKFRALGSRTDFKRIKEILATGKFWCAKFSELNDPMEGGFHACGINPDEIFAGKQEYAICSLAAEESLSNCLMWGYYANGFKGVAIELETAPISIDEMMNSIEPVKYEEHLPTVSASRYTEIKRVLTTKLSAWKHESEWRFLVKSTNSGLYPIGTIKAIHFGNPYGYARNSKKILKQTKLLRTYNSRRNKLVKLAHNMGILCYFMHIDESGEKVSHQISSCSSSSALNHAV